MPGRYRIFALLALALFVFFRTEASLSAERKALPVDEAAKDASLVEFRDRLLDAIVRRDIDYIVAQASEEIQLSFGGHAGRDDFRGFLTLSEDDLSDEYKHEAAERREDYWGALEETIRMGGRFTSNGVFEAPYTSTAPLSETDDSYTTYFVIGDGVALRNRPSRFGDVVATLDHNIVASLDGGEGTPFQEIAVSEALSGFVDRSQLRSLVDYRAIFEKHDGIWRITTFIAGD